MIGGGYRERALEDLIEAERHLRESAESLARAYHSLVVELAQRLAGDALEARRREQPDLLQTWTPRDWQAFFQAVSLGEAGTAWGYPRSNGNGTEAQKVAQLEREVVVLRQRLEQAQIEARMADHAREALQREVERLRAERGRDERRGQVEAPPQPRRLLTEDHLPAMHRRLVEDLKAMVIPQAPLRYRERLKPEDAVRYRRKALILKAIATTGMCARLEIDRVLSVVEGVLPRSNSIRKPADELVESHLLIGDTVRIEHPITTSLAVYRLSEDGKDLCRAWGWEPVESELERILRLHQGEAQEAHTVMILAFTLHARLRGWNVTVLPEVEGRADPDVLVERDGERWYVEVERGDGSRHKWKNLAKLNGGKVALCAADPAGRERLVRDCKAERLGGVAADLRTLVFDGDSPRNLLDISPADPLWLETW